MKNNLSRRASYPHIRDILSPYLRLEYEKFYLDVLLAELEQASKLKSYCLSLLKGEPITQVEAEYLPAIKSFKRWLNKSGAKQMCCKRELFEDTLQFKGDVDLLITLKKEHALLHIQASPFLEKFAPIQLAAQRKLLAEQEIAVKKAFSLSFQPDGCLAKSYTQADLEKGWKVFEMLLKGYAYFIRG